MSHYWGLMPLCNSRSPILAATIGGAIIHKTPDGHLERYAWVGYFALTLILGSIYLAKRVRIVGSA